MLILLLAAMLFATSPVQQSVNGNSNANQGQQQKSDTPPSGTCVNVGGDCSINQPTPKPEADQKKDSLQGRSFWPVSLYEWAGVAGVFSAIILLILMRRQTKANIAAAKAADRSAKAAELTAERFAQMEGARIIVGIDWTGVLGKRTFNDDGTATMFISVTCVNQGRSTAWVKQIRMQADVFHNTIPADPDFIKIPIIYSGIKAIEPQKEYVFPETPSVPARDSLDHWVIVWGIVEYTDMFADRTATFGYIEKIDDRWERLSYPAYNRNTFSTKKT